MYRKFDPKYLFLNLCLSLIFVGVVMYPHHLLLNYWVVTLHWLLGIILMYTLIIRLPIFKQYYINRKKLQRYVIKRSKNNLAEKSCSVMSGIVVFILVFSSLYLFDLTKFYIEYAFIAGFSAGNMSYYYTP